MDRANGDPVWMRIGGVYKEYGRNEYVHKKRQARENLASVVGIPGFEPGMTGPESVVLPLHHIPMFFAIGICISLFASAKVLLFLELPKKNPSFFIKKANYSLWIAFFSLFTLPLQCK